MKRLFDIFFSFIGLILLSPLFIIVAIIIKLDSKGPVFFRQERMGRGFKEFKIYKFRSMKVDESKKGPQITVSGDERITKVGRTLRKYKIDELPQLINVLIGDMSFVGPRPEMRKYVEMFKGDYAKLLKVRPGITDPASVQFSEEEKVLASSHDWEEYYIINILPAKIRLAYEYIDKPRNLLTDIKLIFNTILRIKAG